MSLKPLIALLALALLAGCAAPQSQRGQDPKKDFINDFTKSKIQKNGADLFCDQKSYTTCFKLTRDQCMKELGSFKNDCFNQAQKKYPFAGTEHEVGEFSKEFGGCMALRHVSMHSSDRDLQAVAACLKTNPIDREQSKKSLMK